MDNATNNDTFVRELAIKLKRNTGTEWNYEHLRFRCFNHVLNLAAQSALNEMKDDISRVISLYISTMYLQVYSLENFTQRFVPHPNELNFLKMHAGHVILKFISLL